MENKNEQLILNALFEIKESIGSLSSKLDGMSKDMIEHKVDDRAVEARLVLVENTQNRWKWFAGGISAVVSVIVAFVMKH